VENKWLVLCAFARVEKEQLDVLMLRGGGKSARRYESILKEGIAITQLTFAFVVA
jgi:hypothetical protein